MRLDRETFFAYARRAPFGGRLSTEQVEGMEAILTVWEAGNYTDLRWLANILAQVFHETGGRMVPVREAFATSDKQAIAALDKAWKAGRLKSVKKPYWREGWFGRGPIQITHKANYEKMGRELGVDLVRNPNLLLDPEIGARSTVVGMVKGLFTGKRLSQYFNASADDPKGARAIVNGKDKANLIAGYHEQFLGAVTAADEGSAQPKDVEPEAAQPDDVKPQESKSLWAIIMSIITGGGLTVFSGINNPYSLAAVLFFGTALGVMAFLVLTGRIEIKRGHAI